MEFTSGILQGYYVPLFTDIVVHLGIHDSDINWFEAAQLLVSALVVPVMSKLGDMIGHKRILLLATVLTAGATWWIVFADSFWPFLIAWALQGFYVVWLPLEVALIFERGRNAQRGASSTLRAAGLLVIGLYAGAIAGALAAGRIFSAVHDLPVTLAVPAIALTLTVLVVWALVPDSEPLPNRRLDVRGFVLLALGLLLITGALTAVRLSGPGVIGMWVLLGLGIAVLVGFVRFELRQDDPAVDMRVLRRPQMWPVMATAALIGISVVGAQGPLSTYLGTDRALGYGLGLDSTQRSNMIGVYLVALIAGALLFSLISRKVGPRIGLIVASALVGSATCSFCRSMSRPGRWSRTCASQAWAPARSWARCLRQPPPRHPAARPASLRGSPARRRLSAARSLRPRSASCSPPERAPLRARRRRPWVGT